RPPGVATLEGKENSKAFQPQILAKEKDCRATLDRPKPILNDVTQIKLSGWFHGKHRKSLDVIRSYAARKNAHAPGIQIGNEVRPMRNRWSPGDIPGFQWDNKDESLRRVCR